MTNAEFSPNFTSAVALLNKESLSLEEQIILMTLKKSLTPKEKIKLSMVEYIAGNKKRFLDQNK